MKAKEMEWKKLTRLNTETEDSGFTSEESEEEYEQKKSTKHPIKETEDKNISTTRAQANDPVKNSSKDNTGGKKGVWRLRDGSILALFLVLGVYQVYKDPRWGTTWIL